MPLAAKKQTAKPGKHEQTRARHKHMQRKQRESTSETADRARHWTAAGTQRIAIEQKPRTAMDRSAEAK